MTDKEKKELLDAFGIPEPDRKEEFAEELRLRMSQKEKKRISPIVMRITAAAAMLAVIIGIYAAMPSSPSDIDVSDKIIGTTTTVAYNDESNNKLITTSDTNNNTIRTTALTVSVHETNVTKTAANNKASVSDDKNDVSQHRLTSAAKTVATVQRTTITHTSPKNEKPASGTNTTRITPTTAKPTTIIRKTTTSYADNAPVITDKTEEAMPVNPLYRDMTVAPDVIYTIHGEVVDARHLWNNSYSPVADEPEKGSDSAPNKAATNFEQKIREMFNNSYAVVLAKIDKIVYTSINGMPFSAENISVQEVFKGSLNYNDIITVYVNGGYMPATEYMENHGYIHIDDPENVTVYDNGGCNGKQETGGTYLFFISNDDPDIPYGAFSLSADGDEAVFRKRRNKYICLSDENISFNADFFN